MVKTPWYEQEIPFHQAAEIGTRKVIQEHSTIGLVVTCDGSFGDIPRKNFVDGEEKTVQELKKQGKPFLILVNSRKPYGGRGTEAGKRTGRKISGSGTRGKL